MTRLSYTLAHLGLLFTFVVVAALLGYAIAPWTIGIWLALCVAFWHAISRLRIQETRLPWLHAAPYPSLICLPLGLGFANATPYDAAPDAMMTFWTFFFLTCALTWPAASLSLSILPARRA